MWGRWQWQLNSHKRNDNSNKFNTLKRKLICQTNEFHCDQMTIWRVQYENVLVFNSSIGITLISFIRCFPLTNTFSSVSIVKIGENKHSKAILNRKTAANSWISPVGERTIEYFCFAFWALSKEWKAPTHSLGRREEKRIQIVIKNTRNRNGFFQKWIKKCFRLTRAWYPAKWRWNSK